jgi:hypothetical protein
VLSVQRCAMAEPESYDSLPMDVLMMSPLQAQAWVGLLNVDEFLAHLHACLVHSVAHSRQVGQVSIVSVPVRTC